MKKYFPVQFNPDADTDWSVSPGVLTAVTDMYPTKRGTLKAYACTSNGSISRSPISTFGTPLTGRSLRTYIGSVGHVIIGTTKRLMIADGISSSFLDYSKGAANYSTAEDWHFAVWGSQFIACSKPNPVQTISIDTAGGFATSAFADLGGSPPKATFCCVQKDFLLLADCNDGSNDLPDQVCWSGQGNLTSWTTGANNLATQAGNNRLRDTPGAIRAFLALGGLVVAYKADSIYVGEYTGRSPFFWEWRAVSHSVGCASSHGVAVIGNVHYFIHSTGIYTFDGQTLSLVNNSVTKYIKANSYLLTNMHAAWDDPEGLMVWYLKTSNPTTSALVAGLCLNLYTNKMGWIATPWTGYTAVGVIAGSYADLSVTVMLQPAASLCIPLLGYTGTTIHEQFPSLLGTTCSVTTGDVGDNNSVSVVRSVKPKCLSLTSLSNGTIYTRKTLSEALDAGTTMTVNTTELRYDVMKSNGWHRFTLPMTGAELAGVAIDADVAGWK